MGYYKYDGTYVEDAAVNLLTGKNIVFLGDSLTQQSIGYDNDGFVDNYFHQITVNPHNRLLGWGRIIVENNKMTGREHGRGMQWWYNTDARSEGAVTAVKRLIATTFNPDYIVLEYGTNDCWSGSLGQATDTANEDATSTAGAMRWCIDKLQSTYPSAKIIVVGTVMRNGNAKQNTYREMAKTILADYGVPYLDMMAVSGICKEMLNPNDYVHLAVQNPNYSYDNDRESVRRYARAIESALMQL